MLLKYNFYYVAQYYEVTNGFPTTSNTTPSISQADIDSYTNNVSNNRRSSGNRNHRNNGRRNLCNSTTPQAAEARGCENVPRNSSGVAIAFNASQGRCFGR